MLINGRLLKLIMLFSMERTLERQEWSPVSVRCVLMQLFAELDGIFAYFSVLFNLSFTAYRFQGLKLPFGNTSKNLDYSWSTFILPAQNSRDFYLISKCSRIFFWLAEALNK